MKLEKLVIFTDGGAINNPGPAGIGIVFYDNKNNQLAQAKEFIGNLTNNQAEYRAVIKALNISQEKFQAQEIEFNIDSELVVRQLNGLYKIKNEDLKSLFFQIREKTLEFKSIVFNHIPREKNELADKLVKSAIKNRSKFEFQAS